MLVKDTQGKQQLFYERYGFWIYLKRLQCVRANFTLNDVEIIYVYAYIYGGEMRHYDMRLLQITLFVQINQSNK